MTEILQKWLLTRLGSVVDLRPEQIGSCCRDGMLFAQLLHNYDVISAEQLMLLDCSNSVSNMKNLSHWMKSIGVECTDETINNVICGDGLTSTSVLYQLYLNLEDKDRLLFTTDISCKHRPINDRFTVTTVANDRDESIRKDNALSLPLAANRDIIAWYKNKHNEVSAQLESIRERYKKKLKQDVEDELRLSALEKRIKKSIDDEYAELQQQINNFEDKIGDTETLAFCEESSESLVSDNRQPFNADEYMATLKERKRKMNSYRNTKVKLQNLIFDELWNNMLAKREEAFDFTISSKMLKQSQYEKQMTTKLFEIRHQRDIILDNRKILDKMIARKRDEELAKELFERKRVSDEKKLNFLAEKRRAMELHRRIYEEKKQKEAEKNYSMCYGTVEDIVDIAIKIGHYRKSFDEDVPCELINEYKALFFACQPIFDVLKNVEDIIEEEDINDYIRLEKERQRILNEHDFAEYLSKTGSWYFPDDTKSSEENLADLECINGKRIYGHVIHKLLTAKYPYPEPPKPPELPPFSIAVCVLGVNDFTILPTLQIFLNKRNICIIEMQNAINFCLQAFKDEMIGIDEIDLAFALQTAKDLMSNEKKSEKVDEQETKRSLGKKIEKPPDPVEPIGKEKDNKKKDDKKNAGNILPVELAMKETQTPKCLPEEECMAKMSNKAILGKYAYQSLSVGQPVTDLLLMAMLIEYLKTFTDKDGFVLFNYPTTYPEAIIMEETVTAKKVPNAQLDLHDSIDDFEGRDSSETDLTHSCKYERYSRLVLHPHSKSESDPYTTFLTAFIEVKHREAGSINQEKEEDGEEEEEELDLLSNFYTEQGVNYSLFYNTFDLQTIKHLAKLIIGDYSLPRKTSEELFGNLEELELASQKTGKKPTAKKVENKDASKEKIKGIKNHSAEKVDEKKAKDHETEAKEEIMEIGENVTEDALVTSDGEATVPEMEPEPVLPGDEKYEYVNLPQSDVILKGLASLSETSEYVFINDLKEIFFIRRTLISTIMPYITSVKQHMKQFIERPDMKQNFVYDFQKMYNEIDEDVRDDVEFKAELHCRLEELKENLWSISDQRMSEAEEERQRIINERWMTDQMCILLNLFISCMQVTIDFWTDELQVINDYYETMMGKQLDEEITSDKLILERMTTVKNNSQTDLKEKQHSPIDNGVDAGLIIAEVLKDVKSEMLPENNPFHVFIENVFNTAISIGATFDASIENVQILIDALNSPKKGGKPAGGKDSKKGAKKLPPPSNIDEIIEHSPKILNEWLFALKSGKHILSLRLNLIRTKAEKDITMLQNCAVETFHGIYKQISERYENEINSITTLCSAVSKAIEEEIKIQPQLLLEGDQFIVEKDILLYPDLLPEPEGPIHERITPSEFTIEQLNMLYKILTDIAPTGSIPERTFSFILQDLIVHNAEDGFKGVLPGIWAAVNSNEVTDLIKQIYGDSEYLDWRDFIIYNFDIQFPSEHIILETFFQFLSEDKNKNELITEESFKSFKLWFEDDKNSDPQLELRIQLLKELLFKMFLVERGVANYTAMLIAFCKDENPIVGLAKAFSIAAKSLICWNNEEGEKYVEIERSKREMIEKLRLEAESAAKVVISDVIDTTLQHTEGVIITEVVSQHESLTEKEESVKSTYSEECEGEGDIDVMFENIEEYHSYTQIVDCLEPLSISDTDDKEYFLSFGIVLNVLTACLPWHIRNQMIENKTLRQQLENVFKDLPTDLNGDGKILSHQFFKHPFVTKLLSNIHKFKVVRPVDVIIEIMKNRK